MADGTTINIGTGGDVVATDDIAGVKYQRVKLIHGTDGVNDGDASASNPFPATLSLLEKLEDAGHTSGDRGIMALAVRSATATPLAGANLDYIPIIVDATGRLWVTAIVPACGTRGSPTPATRWRSCRRTV